MQGKASPENAPEPRRGRAESEGVSDSAVMLGDVTGWGASKLAFEDEEDLDKIEREPGPQTSQAVAGPRPLAETEGTGTWQGRGGLGCVVAALGFVRTALCILQVVVRTCRYLLDWGLGVLLALCCYPLSGGGPSPA